MGDRLSDDVDERVDRLEKELSKLSGLHEKARRDVNHLKLVVLVVVLGSVAAAATVWSVRTGAIELKDVLGSSMPPKLESKEFGLYNRDGKRVLFADYDKWGYPSLVFLDLDLNYRMGLKIYGDGSPGMVFYDKTGTRASFRMGEKGESLLQLLGEKQKGGAILEVAADGSPHFKMSDASGHVVFEAPAASTATAPGPAPADEGGRPKMSRPRR